MSELDRGLADISGLGSAAREFIPLRRKRGRPSPLMEIAEAICAHVKDRYELKRKPGKPDLSYNEIAGIVATHLDLGSFLRVREAPLRIDRKKIAAEIRANLEKAMKNQNGRK